MSKDNSYLVEQRKRLTKVLDYLKSQGISQKEISNKCDIDYTYITHYKTGKINLIPDDFLEKMQLFYNINPQYIRLNSNFMFDLLGMKLSNFEIFVDSWNTVEKSKVNSSGTPEIEKYLHFTMDKNFYDFLIDVDTAHLATDEGISSLDNEIKNLRELFNGEPDLQEYVLLPRNNFINILEETAKARQSLYEVINFSEHEPYLNE